MGISVMRQPFLLAVTLRCGGIKPIKLNHDRSHSRITTLCVNLAGRKKSCFASLNATSDSILPLHPSSSCHNNEQLRRPGWVTANLASGVKMECVDVALARPGGTLDARHSR